MALPLVPLFLGSAALKGIGNLFKRSRMMNQLRGATAGPANTASATPNPTQVSQAATTNPTGGVRPIGTVVGEQRITQQSSTPITGEGGGFRIRLQSGKPPDQVGAAGAPPSVQQDQGQVPTGSAAALGEASVLKAKRKNLLAQAALSGPTRGDRLDKGSLTGDVR